MTKVYDHYSDREFEDMLGEAEENASGDWEETFVSDLRDKFAEYGMSMYLSDKQKDILERIANGD